MFYNQSSIFGQLQSNISNSMSLNIQSLSQIASIGNVNAMSSEHISKKIGKNIHIICNEYICDDQNNDYFCE